MPSQISPAGRIDTYAYPVYSNPSRAFNRTERESRFIALEEAMDSRIEQVRQEMAKEYLAFLREMITPFNTRRHEITIMAAMGTAIVLINGEMLNEYTAKTPVVERLDEIAQVLEGGWDWACYLDGERLNPPVSH